MHPRANLDDHGGFISDYGPGRAVRRRISHRVATGIHQRGWISGLETIERLIGKHAMNGLAGASRRGEAGLVALLHACKGACIDMQDYEMAQRFQDMADQQS